MTCELCSLNRLDVTTYTNSLGLKYNLCTPCCRKVDAHMDEIMRKLLQDARVHFVAWIDTTKKTTYGSGE